MQKREQQGTKQNRKARKEKKQKTSHHHHNHNHNHNNNNNNNKNVRFNPLRQVSLPKKGPVTPVIYPWISKAITVDLTRANSNDPRSQQIHQKKMLAECCSVHQIFAGNSLTITSEKHGVEIPAEIWM